MVPPSPVNSGIEVEENDVRMIAQPGGTVVIWRNHPPVPSPRGPLVMFPQPSVAPHLRYSLHGIDAA